MLEPLPQVGSESVRTLPCRQGLGCDTAKGLFQGFPRLQRGQQRVLKMGQLVAADNVVAAKEGDELGLRVGQRRSFAVLPRCVVAANWIAEGEKLEAGDEGKSRLRREGRGS